MRTYITTSWFYWKIENDYSKECSKSDLLSEGVWNVRNWFINNGSLEEGLNELSKFCDENSLEIKGFMPIDSAESHESALLKLAPSTSGGYGFGWGITMTDGFVAILQRSESLTEEQYGKKVKVRELKNEILNETISVKNIQDEIHDCGPKINLLKDDVDAGLTVEKQGLFGRNVKYIVGSNVFKEKIDAQNSLDDLEKELHCLIDKKNMLSKEVENKQEKIRVMESEIGTL